MLDLNAPEISAVIPCLNEIENAELIAKAVDRYLASCARSHEIIFIDNGSTDGTRDALRELCAANPHIRAIFNNKNYGQMRSPTHGIYQAMGEAIIGISADFQDPPELIPDLVERWRRGAAIVLGVRKSEHTSALLTAIRAVGYGFFSRFGDYRVIPGATGFGLYDRKVVDALKRWRDPEPFFRGMLVESGFDLETIPYHRPGRAGGASKNHIGSLFLFAVSGVASSSKNLLRWPLFIALGIFPFAALTLCGAGVEALLGRDAVPTLIGALAELSFALLMFFIGLLGEQVRLISEMSRDVPLVIERERLNFP